VVVLVVVVNVQADARIAELRTQATAEFCEFEITKW
jgi:hypothetical protein